MYTKSIVGKKNQQKASYLLLQYHNSNIQYSDLELIFNLLLIIQRHIKEGITIIVVRIKKIPQSPLSQSTRVPEDEARVVLPAVPNEASRAYCVAV